MKLNFLSCPVCNSKNYKKRFSDTLSPDYPSIGYGFSSNHCKTYQIVQCLDCSHGYCNPVPKDIYKHYIDKDDVHYLSYSKERHLTAKKILTLLHKLKPTGSLLDIGCSTGDFLQESEKYYSSEGLEVSTWAFNIARKKKLTIHYNHIGDFSHQNKYDIITMFGVIEHLEELQETIHKIKSFLNEDGLAVIWTGDFNSISSKLFKEKWWYIMGQHIQYFTKSSIKKLFNMHDFDLIKYKFYPYALSFRQISNSLMRYPFLKPLSYLLTFIPGHITLRVPGEMLLVFQRKANKI
jgi:SAM-dependent methyltransferase